MSAISFSRPKTFFAGAQSEEVVKKTVHQSPDASPVKVTETTVLQPGQKEPVEIFTAQVPRSATKTPILATRHAPVEWEKQLARWGKRMERIMIVASMIPVMVATLVATVVRVIASLFKERSRLKSRFTQNPDMPDSPSKMKVAGNLLKSKFDEMFDRSKKALSSSQPYQSVDARNSASTPIKSTIASIKGEKPQTKNFRETIRAFFAPYPPEVVNSRK